MPEILAPGSAEQRLERSRFLAFAERAPSLAAAKERQEALRRAHPGARHVVLAARVAAGETWWSDDGEPHGTGGAPLLLLLERHALTASALYVVRYFGGQKLGARRLRAAYVAAATQALAQARTGEREVLLAARLIFRPEHNAAVQRIVHSLGGRVVAADFGALAGFTVHFPRRDLTAWQRACAGFELRLLGEVDQSEV